MFRFRSLRRTMLRFGGWCSAAVILACLGLSGCANLNLRGEQFQYDPISEWDQDLRPRDQQTDFFGFSNKAREIERHCGVQ